MHLNIRSKLILFTIGPVFAVYLAVFWLGLGHLSNHLGGEAQRLLAEHARHQGTRLALLFSPVPALAEYLGALVVGDPQQEQDLLYAHLIDGLRRTPIAKSASVVHYTPPRSASMRRGAAAGQELSAAERQPRFPGWQAEQGVLHFTQAMRLQGTPVGETRIEVALADLYVELDRLRTPGIQLFVADSTGALLQPPTVHDTAEARAAAATTVADAGRISHVTDTVDGGLYWIADAPLPGFPWRVFAVTSAEAALHTARREASLFAIGLLGSLLAIVLIIGLVARRITSPLATLDSSVREIGRGNFDVAPKVEAQDELGALAHAIRLMARHIAERERLLRESQTALEMRVSERTEALQSANARLIQQIDETRKTEDALRLANEQAQNASRAKSEFLSNISHELRTPLHGVLGYAQILRRDSAPNSSQRDGLEAIERCGQHLLTLINQILDLTRIEAGQMQVDLRPTSFSRLLGDVRSIVMQRASTKGLEVGLRVAHGIPATILTDPVKLKQILLNLLGNAIKFTSRGQIQLRVDTPDPRQLRFTVTDTGIGIPMDRIHSIFDAFHQVPSGQSTDGTGLGLAISQRLIRLLGGTDLEVESRLGVGSSFQFTIPMESVDSDAGNPKLEDLEVMDDDVDSRLRLSADQQCRVLVIDPTADSRKLLTALLRASDCETESCAAPSMARRILRDSEFDLIFLDVSLSTPRADSVLTELRGAGPTGSAKLVAVSGEVMNETERTARQAGFDAFLGKPFDDQRLFDLISRLLRIRFEPMMPAPPAASDPLPQVWPADLALSTAKRLRAAVDLGDIAALEEISNDLAERDVVPNTTIEALRNMTSQFDFDSLRRFAERLLGDRE